jgi:hypothetical protein
MDSYQIAQLLALALAVAVLVILIVVLTRNNLSTAVADDETNVGLVDAKVTMLDNKVNWLFALEIASVGIMVLFGLIAFFGWMRWQQPCA